MSNLSFPSWPPQRQPLKPVVALHADEILQRWRRRELAQHSQEVQFVQGIREDDLLAAHLHALVVAGSSALTVAQDRCRRGTPADHFVRTWTLLAAQDGPAQAHQLLDTLNALASEPAALGAACDTLRWAPPDWQAQTLAVQCLGLASGPVADALLRLCGQQRWPVDPALLRTWLEHPRADARRAAYEHCASLGLHAHLDLLIEHSDCAAAAAAAFRLGERQHSVPHLMQLVTAPTSAGSEGSALSPQDVLVELCASLPLPDSRAAWHEVLAAQAKRAESSIQADPFQPCAITTLLAAAEASNDPAHLPWLMQRLEEPEHRGSAEAALSWLTGFDPDDVFPNPAEGTAPGYSVADVEQWLARQPLPRSRQLRWLAGASLSRSNVFETLWHGCMRFRHHAARHLAWAAPHEPRVCLQAPASQQIRWLHQADSAL